MVSEEKIKLMIDAKRHEIKGNEKEVKVNKLGSVTFIAIRTALNVVYYTIAYIMIAVVFVVYKADYLLSDEFLKHYKSYLGVFLGPYILIILLAITGSIIYYKKVYKENKIKILEYEASLNVLKDYYENNERERGN